jgi:peroxiredoxin
MRPGGFTRLIDRTWGPPRTPLRPHHVADAYGVWAEKSMYGKKYFGNERTTFVIDPDGRVSAVLRKVKPAEHDEQVLKALESARPPVL